MSYKLYFGGLILPVTPGKIETVINGKNETVTLINEGEVNVLKSPGLTDINIPALLLPVHAYPFAYDPIWDFNDTGGQSKYNFGSGSWATFWLNKFEEWKVEKRFIQFKLIRTSPDEKTILWATQMDTSLEDYRIVEDAEEQGDDVVVELNLKQYEQWGAKKLKVTGKNKTPKPNKPRKPQNKNIKKYTIKDGDTLKKIARKFLNDGGLWEKIYKTNKNIIEDAAKKNGRKSSDNGMYLYKGTEIKINMKDAITGGCAGNGNVDTSQGGGGR